MKLISKAFFLILVLSSVVFSQNNLLISGRLGIIKSYGTAEGFEISAKRMITNNFLFQFTAGYYSWSDSRDLNRMSLGRVSNNVTKKEMDNLIPVKVGFSYLFGDQTSRPFLSIEWAVNRANLNYYESPNILTNWSYVPTNKYSQSTLYVSMGFSMGYVFSLVENMNLLTGVFYQTGSGLTYNGLIAGFEYDL